MKEMVEMHSGHGRQECMELAEAYVLFQTLDGVYMPEEGLKAGTIFPSLSRPYEGWRKRAKC